MEKTIPGVRGSHTVSTVEDGPTSWVHCVTLSDCRNVSGMSGPELEVKIGEMIRNVGYDLFHLSSVQFPPHGEELVGGMTVSGIIGASSIYVHTSPGEGDVQAMVHSCIDPKVNPHTTKQIDRDMALNLFDRIGVYFGAARVLTLEPLEHPVKVPDEVSLQRRVHT